jgi:hypothetical protein
MSGRELVAVLAEPLVLHPNARPSAVSAVLMPEAKGTKLPPVGPVLIAPATGLALLGVAVLAAERTPNGFLVVLASAGTFSPRVSPGDVIGTLI